MQAIYFLLALPLTCVPQDRVADRSRAARADLGIPHDTEVVCASRPVQDTHPEDPTYDLSLAAEVGQPIAAELSVKYRGSAEITILGETEKRKMDGEQSVEFVDEFSVLEDDAWQASRTYLRWHDTRDGIVQDPELTGVRALFGRKDGQHQLELDDRLVLKSTLGKLLEHAPTLGVWFELPTAVRMEETIAIEPIALAHLLTDSDAGAELSASGQVTLASVGETGVALLQGALRVVAEETENDVTTRTELDGECLLRIDTSEQRLIELEWSGTAVASFTGPHVSGKGSIDFEAELKTVSGESARKALGSKPTYREVPRDVAAHHVSLDLPSHWYVLTEDPYQFQTTILGSETPVTLEVKSIDFATGTHEAFIDAVVAKLREDYPSIRDHDVRSSLGSGKALELENEGNSYLIELYPLGPNRILRARLFGSAAALEQGLEQWPKTRRTLEKLKGSK